MKIIETPLVDCKIIEPAVWGDDRGFFIETYKKADLAQAGITVDFVQDNHSKSAKGVLRGMHFQYHKPQAKLVRVTTGSAYDVVIDLRHGSPSFGQWFGVILSAENKKQLYVPTGFAHGFVSLEDGTEFLYKVSDVYDPTAEDGVMRDDPVIGIDWQSMFDQYDITQPQLSHKDTTYQPRAQLPEYFTY